MSPEPQTSTPADASEYSIVIPPCIADFPHLTPEERVMKLKQHRNPKDIKKITEKYIVFRKDSDGKDFAEWNPSGVPTYRQVKDMLDTYHLQGLYPFRKVQTVNLLGRGLNNLYFYVRFHDAETTEEMEATSQLPSKVILRFLLPLFASVDPKNKHDSKLESKLEYEIAVMSHMSKYTNLVPKVIVFDPWGQNELQLEWLMMEYKQGFVLQRCGETVEAETACTCETGLDGLRPLVPKKAPVLSSAQKQKIRDQVRQIFRRAEQDFKRFANLGATVGGLGINWETSELRKSELTLEQFYINERKYGVKRLQLSRGPFDSVEAYLDESMKVAYPNLDEGVLYIRKMHLLRTLEVDGLGLQEVLNFMRRFDFPTEENGWPVTIQHTNLHEGNVLVDGNGELIAILGWEDAIVFPTAWRGLLEKLDTAFKQLHDNEVFRPLSDIMRPFRQGSPFDPARRSHGNSCACPPIDFDSPLYSPAGASRLCQPRDKQTGRTKRVIRRLTGRH